MTAFSSFYGLIKPYADGVAAPAMDNALRQAAIEFCKRTFVWQLISAPVTVTVDINTYVIDVPAESEIVKIMRLAYDKRSIDPQTADDLDMKYADWTEETGTPSCYTQITPEKIILVPMPAATLLAALSYRAAYMPSQGATVLPDILYRQYAQDIAHGAMALLLSESNRGYFSPQEAQRYESLFEKAIDKAQMSAASSFTRAPKRSRANYF